MKYQSYTYGKNHWLLEPDLKAILARYWRDFPAHESELLEFGEMVGGRAYEVADHVDHSGGPVLVAHDLGGKRVDRARLSPAHAELLKQLVTINRAPWRKSAHPRQKKPCARWI
jgi:hypothetical protein